MKKRVFTLALALAVIITACSGCSGGSPNSTPKTTPTSTYKSPIYSPVAPTPSPAATGAQSTIGSYEGKSGARYIGMLNSDGVADGMVVRFSAGEFEGDFYVGEFHDGNYDGMGVYIWAEGHKYLGRYENGDRQGAGITLNADGSIRQTSDGKKMVGNWDKDKFSAETRTNDDGSYGSEDTFLIKYEEEDKRWEVQRKLGELVLVYDNGGILVTCNAGWVTVMGISRQVGIGTDRTPIRGSYYEVYDFDGNFIETRQL